MKEGLTPDGGGLELPFAWEKPGWEDLASKSFVWPFFQRTRKDRVGWPRPKVFEKIRLYCMKRQARKEGSKDTKLLFSTAFLGRRDSFNRCVTITKTLGLQESKGKERKGN